MENEKEKKKIIFFKKVWYSLLKTNKYTDMEKEGVGSAIRYFFAILGIILMIISIVFTISQISSINSVISYIDENLPEMVFKDNKLEFKDSGEAIVLSENRFINLFRNTVIINPQIEKEKAIDEYYEFTAQGVNVVVFLSDEYIVINKDYNPENEDNNGIEIHKYKDESSKYIKDGSAEYGNDHLISYLKQSISPTYYFGQFFGIYFILIGAIYIFYILMLSASFWLISKILKYKWTFKKCFINTVYASTLSLIVHIIYITINYFTGFKISFMDAINIILIYVYIFILLSKEKRDLQSTK